jgi:selenide,water dikinase
VLIQTVDVLTPISDDPSVFGKIAAANAMSDVYAMGGEPITVLNILCYPPEIPSPIVAEIVKGAMDKVREGGAVVVGGHTIKDQEVKLGLSVTGIAERSALITNSGARPGDLLVLTKPLGTGVISTAVKQDVASKEATEEAERWMSELNVAPSRAMVRVHANAATDITGFGFLGHARLMAESSSVGIRIDAARVPLLTDARKHADQGLFPGGSKANYAYVAPHVIYGKGIPEPLRMLLCDAQTSGGLLISIPADRLDGFGKEMSAGGAGEFWVVGEVTDGKPGSIEVRERIPDLLDRIGKAGPE